MSGARTGVRQYAERIAARRRDFSSTMIFQVVTLVSTAIIFPINVRVLGASDYGQYIVLYVIFGLIGLGVFAAPNAAVTQLVLQLDYDSRATRQVAKRQILVSGAPSSVIGILIAVALLGWDVLLPAVLILGVDFLLTSLTGLNTATVFAVDGVVRAARLKLITPSMKTFGVVLLALGGGLSIVTLALVNIAASATLLWRSAHAVRHPLVPTEPVDHRPSPRELIRYSWYYGTTMLTNVVQTEGEKLVLATWRPTQEVGQYAAAYRIVSISMLPLSAVGFAANRWFLQRDLRKGAQLARARRLAVLTTVYGVVVAVVILLGRDVIAWVVGGGYDDVAVIAGWLCLLPLLHGLAELPPMGLIGLGRNRERMVMGFATAALALVSYLTLVPVLGWPGAVIGTYISELATIVIGFALLARYQKAADLALEASDRAPDDGRAHPETGDRRPDHAHDRGG